MSRVHIAVFAGLIVLGNAPVRGDAPGSVSGTVRDSAGVPQIGAVVELLHPDLSVAASVSTDGGGRFAISSVSPGRYALKAMGASFLPSMRENVRVRAHTVVNLTLITLYEVMQWLPAEPRAAKASQDDWAWTLRSAANRPLLRWLEDGPLVVVTDRSGAATKLKARLMASGQEGTFGESGERISATIEETPSDSRALLARVDFSPKSDAGMESMLGFRQDLGYAGSVQSLAAMAIHPEVDTGGLDEAFVRTEETLHLGDEFDGEVGSEQVVARLGGSGSRTVAAALPFASAAWKNGSSSIRYRMTTILPNSQEAADSEAHAWAPAFSARNGALALEDGLHQEIGWERRTDVSNIAASVFADRIQNPVLEAMGHFANGDSTSASAMMLFDRSTGLLRAAGPEFSTAGAMASAERNLPGGYQIRLSYANGSALVLPAAARPAALAQVLAGTHPHRAQTYALSLSGTIEGTGTRWQASFRWQPEATVTPVAEYAADAEAPYLNWRLRQPIHLHRDGSGGFEGLLDVRNLLAQGYRPYMLSDGSLLIFAQDQRSFRAGLAFTF